nr:BrnT family toxin [Thiocystis violacea]
MFAVVFVDRSDARRLISLRKANQREINHYATS